jgi:hypothetical protein
MELEDRFWGTISRTFERMTKEAPAGYAARVQVELVTRETFVPVIAQVHLPWVLFEVEDQPSVRVVAVHPEHIAKVEIALVKRDAQQREGAGFRVRQPDSSAES